jgi:hypothetical protein|tara:strand:- start:2118 stop:2747 length:630 start_codon:yes stop_codon:yes gene_type:complete
MREMKIEIKKSTINDSLFFLKTRNEVTNRKQFFNTAKISVKEHSQWYSLNYRKNIFYTCYVNKVKSGYIRGEIKKDILLISIAFIKKFQNKGIGTESYKLFEKKIKKGVILIAKVKKSNPSSQNFFLKNKFSLLNKKKTIFTYYKICLNNKNNYLKAISDIEKVRKGNNVNWMNILRVAFQHSPQEASTIFRNIFKDDKKINKLSKRLF